MSDLGILQNAAFTQNLALTVYNAALAKGMNAASDIWWSKVAQLVPSTSEQNLYAWLHQIAGFREWSGERFFHPVAQDSYVLANKDWEDGVQIDRNKFRDNQFLDQATLFEVMGYNAKKHPDERVANLMTGYASLTCYNGLTFFNTAHPVNRYDSSLSTFSNRVTNTLTPANVALVRRAMTQFKDPAGRILARPPDTLIVPPSLVVTAQSIASGLLVPTISSTSVQFIAGNQVQAQSFDVLEIPELEAEPTVWYMARLKHPVKPFLFQKRTDPVVEWISDLNSEFCKVNKAVRLGADYSAAFGYTFPHLMIRAGDGTGGATTLS